MTGFRTESCILKHSDDVKSEWLELQQRADHSYFLSWGWIGTWLDEIAIGFQPIIVKVWSGEALIGLGLFVSRDVKRRLLFHAKALYLNEYPFDGRNMVIEYNGLLAARDFEEVVYRETLSHLLAVYRELDEFCFGALPEIDAARISPKQLVEPVRRVIDEESLSWSIELKDITDGIEGFLASLSRNRRGQIRRSLKLYDQDGSLQIIEAGNITQALSFFERLKILHTEYWQSKSRRGSFANPLWEAFHHCLINRRFDRGEIQLLKICNDHGEIGYIYNLLLDKRVYVVQTGFVRTEDKRLLPGYVAHVLAIIHNSAKGMHVYDLMHGDTLYKRILCNRKQRLQWVVLQRRKLKFSIENFAVSMVRHLRRNTDTDGSG